MAERTLYPSSNISYQFSGGKTYRIGYKNEKKARETIKIIKVRSIKAQKNIINTLFQRAKFHPNQTPDMRRAMRVFKAWIISHSR